MKFKNCQFLIQTLKKSALEQKPEIRLKIVLELLQKDNKTEIDPNCKDEAGKPALIIAIQSPIEFGKLQIVQAFIQSGADINQSFRLIGDSSLEWCSGEREREYFEEEGLTPILAASMIKDSTILQLLLDHKANIHAKTSNDANTPLSTIYYADLTGTQDPETAVIEYGRSLNPHMKQKTCLDFALSLTSLNMTTLNTMRMSLAVIELLIDNGCDVSAENITQIKNNPTLLHHFKNRHTVISKELNYCIQNNDLENIVMGYLSQRHIEI